MSRKGTFYVENINPKNYQTKPIVIINGTGGCGKNTFVNMFDENAAHISMVDIVRELITKMGLTSDTKDENYRRFMHSFKRALEDYNDLPFQSVMCDIQKLMMDPNVPFIFIDMREPADVARIEKIYDIFTVLVHNPRVADISTNYADASVYDISYDYIIENDGDLEKLRESAETLQNEITKKWNIVSALRNWRN